MGLHMLMYFISTNVIRDKIKIKERAYSEIPFSEGLAECRFFTLQIKLF